MILWYKCWVKKVEYARKSDQASHSTIKLYHVSTTHTHTCTYIAIHIHTHNNASLFIANTAISSVIARH